MSTFDQVRDILTDSLQLGSRGRALTASTQLLDNIPEFDSMAVVTIVTALEERFDIMVDDDELTAEHFESVGTLVAFVESKLNS